MSVTIYGRWHGDAIFEDGRDDVKFERVPVRLIGPLYNEAAMRDAGYAAWAGRRYDRDVLLALRHDVEANALPELDDCSNCHDAPGVHDMGDGCTFCPGCASAAQGSHYDDRTPA
jgi:hypothetical protein